MITHTHTHKLTRDDTGRAYNIVNAFKLQEKDELISRKRTTTSSERLGYFVLILCQVPGLCKTFYIYWPNHVA